MPLFFQHEIDKDTRLAVWHITEPEDFFDVPLQRNITHPHKRLQHRAGRFLLKYLFPHFPLELILIADTRKPYLEEEAFQFSVSHCGNYAAAIASRHKRVGIDVEEPSGKVQRIRHKFLSAGEEAFLASVPLQPEVLATVLWSAKEACFKWYGLGQVDFRVDMPVREINMPAINKLLTHLQFGKELDRPLDVESRLFHGLCLSFIANH